MCGFVGFTGATLNNERLIANMCERIIHRGPDDGGRYLGDGITLGFRRLSILDLSCPSQPWTSEDGRFALVYNGEIYNYIALRDELAALGYKFKTNCDTEVVLCGFVEWGRALIPRLRGMFAIAVWDNVEKTVFCARDPFGIKPLYYTVADGEFIFGSEIKAMLEHPAVNPRVNPRALRPYLSFQYSSTSETFFDGIYKLPPAHTLTYKDGKVSLERYWDVEFDADESRTLDDFADELERDVRESVKLHRQSDVPVGSFLSGGVDSSYITACLMPEHTFSVGFGDAKFNETAHAEHLSELLGVEHHTKIITAEECFDAFPQIQYHMDEPQANPSSVPLWFLAKLTREYVTVVLSGEGADEIWGGYEWYDDTPALRKYKRIPAPIRRAAAKAAKRLPYFKGHDMIVRGGGVPEDYFIGQAFVFSDREAKRVLSDKYKNAPSPFDITRPVYDKVKGADELTKKQYLDISLWLPGDILLKADKMSMAHSLELRVPYLDRVVMASAQKIPSRYRVNEGGTKYVLRRAANRTLPDEWATRPKMGFPVPIRNWLREDRFYELVKAEFTSPHVSEFFNVDELMRILDEHKSGKSNNQRRIWVVYTFLVWYRQFFIDYKRKPLE